VRVKVIEGALKEELLTVLRDEATGTAQFKEALSRLGALLISEALKGLKTSKVKVKTPVALGRGRRIAQEVVFIPVLRAGLSFLPPALELYPSGRLGFIGVYRNEESLNPVPYYVKLPLIKGAEYILLDPMLATGGTARYCVELLTGRGVPATDITFVSLVSAPEGLKRLEGLEGLTVITAAVDERLNSKGYIVPGLGDAGDRFCGTEGVEVVESYGV